MIEPSGPGRRETEGARADDPGAEAADADADADVAVVKLMLVTPTSTATRTAEDGGEEGRAERGIRAPAVSQSGAR